MINVNPVDVSVAAVLLPPVVALLNQRHWPAPLKALLALAVCLLYATGVVWWRGGLDLTHWRETALVVSGSAFAAYQLWWRPSNIAPAIEAATSADMGRAEVA